VLVGGAVIDDAVSQERGRRGYLLRRSCYYEGIARAVGRTRGGYDLAYSQARLRPPNAATLQSFGAQGTIAGLPRIAALGQIGAVIGGLTAADAGYLSGAVTLRPDVQRSRTSQQTPPHRGSSSCTEM
jgi:hypothetical protein